jgi:glycosidase
MLFNRDNCRTPMQWSGGVNAGFTATNIQPWLPVLESADTINVEDQLSDPHSLLMTNQQLLKLRRETPALKWGSLRWITTYDQGDILGFERIYRDERVQIFINFSEEEQRLAMEEGRKILFTTGVAVMDKSQLTIGANTGVILE